ncbi:MAG: HEAT repeat domain-containing protein, partial [Acidobacteria bacterium]|nr:HEAT repeat domain-containing protein [Acidobacteriota bacterium]
PEVREQAAFALFRLRFAPVWRKQVPQPPPLPKAAVEATAEVLGDEDVRVRRAAAHTFSRYGEAAARAALEKALKDGDELVRIFAARGLARGGDGAAAPELAAHLGDPSAKVRGEIVRALATLGAADSVPASAGQDDDFQVRAAAATAWASNARPETDAALDSLLEDPSPTVRAAAIVSLGGRRGAAFAPTLREILSSGPWTSRVAAARAAGNAGEAAAGLLLEALNDEDGRVQAAALESLDAFSDGLETTERIARALDSADLAVRGTAVTALADRGHPDKVRWLERTVEASPGVDWVEIREGVVDALRPEDGGEDLLKRLASDSAPSVARRARLALEARGLSIDESSPVKAAAEPSPFLSVELEEAPVVVLETEKGKLTIETLPREAPLHVASFLQLVGEGFYDGLIWHRVVPNFVIQGGDPLGNGWGGPGYALRDEIYPRPFERGSVGMPKAGKDTGGCQVFITHIPTPHLDG